jgi:hypothetical protein
MSKKDSIGNNPIKTQFTEPSQLSNAPCDSSVPTGDAKKKLSERFLVVRVRLIAIECDEDREDRAVIAARDIDGNEHTISIPVHDVQSVETDGKACQR